jgi:hypothetical protein
MLILSYVDSIIHILIELRFALYSWHLEDVAKVLSRCVGQERGQVMRPPTRTLERGDCVILVYVEWPRSAAC